MARARVRKPPMKRHHSERFRGANLFVERWSNAKAAHIGFHLGQCLPFTEVAKILNDGTSPETLRSRAYTWRLPVKGRKSGVLVSLTPAKRALMMKQAAKLNITPEEFLKAICETVIRDDLYNAVVDGG